MHNCGLMFYLKGCSSCLLFTALLNHCVLYKADNITLRIGLFGVEGVVEVLSAKV